MFDRAIVIRGVIRCYVSLVESGLEDYLISRAKELYWSVVNGIGYVGLEGCCKNCEAYASLENQLTPCESVAET